jgi:hypothetical protein
MLGWDGKHWFALSGLYVSGVSVGSSVAVSEYNSAINATASTGSVIYPLFSAANASLNKVWRSKLRYEQSYIVTKQGLRFYLAHQINDPSTYGPISIQVDTSSANNQGQLLINPLYTNVTFQNNNFLNITWNTTVAPPTSTVSFFVNRYDPEATDVQVYGQALGVTGQTHAGDVTIISMSLLYRDYSIMA